MRRSMVRYTVKPGHAEQNEALVRAVYRELEQTQPAGLRYATFKLDDGVTFVHVASLETDDGHNPLTELTAFREFQADIRARCAEDPTVSRIEEIGSFGWLGAPAASPRTP
jgi:hypothetical protein